MEKLTLQQALDKIKELHKKYANESELSESDRYKVEISLEERKGVISKEYYFIVHPDDSEPMSGFTFSELEAELTRRYGAKDDFEIIC